MNSKKGVTSLFLKGPSSCRVNGQGGTHPGAGRQEPGRDGQNGASAAGMVWRGQHLSAQGWPRGGRAADALRASRAGPARAGSVQGTWWSEGGQLSQMTPEARTTGGLVHLTGTAQAQVPLLLRALFQKEP